MNYEKANKVRSYLVAAERNNGVGITNSARIRGMSVVEDHQKKTDRLQNNGEWNVNHCLQA